MNRIMYGRQLRKMGYQRKRHVGRGLAKIATVCAGIATGVLFVLALGYGLARADEIDTLVAGMSDKDYNADSNLSKLISPADVKVVDGDSLRIGEYKLRIEGIDAPERKQPGGEQSKRVMQSIIDNSGGIRCLTTGQDRYERNLVNCFTDKGDDIAVVMVLSGYAFAYEEYSDAYVSQQEFAQKTKQGLWADSEVEFPWDYRRRKRNGQ